MKTRPPEDVDYTDRDAFGLRLQQYYHQYAVKEAPFMLIALRGDSDDAQALDFSFLYECIRKLLRDQDDWLVDLENKRLIILMAHSHPEDAKRFFARLKIRLYKAAPQVAEAYLYAISAITVPNGFPFHTAEDFLSVALEED